MKKNLFFLLIPLIIIFVGLMSCQKDLLVTPKDEGVDPSVTKYTVEATVVGLGGTVTPSGVTQVTKGSNVNFAINAELGFKEDSIIVNGESFLLAGSTYTLNNINSDVNIQIVFKKTLSWFLMNGEWKNDSLIIEQRDGTWSHYPLWGVPGENQRRITFLPTGRTAIYLNDQYVGDGPWSLNEETNPPTIQLGGQDGQILTIEALDEDNLILAQYDVPNIDDPSVFSSFKDTYTHTVK